MSGQFYGLIEAAANLTQQGEKGTYTSEMFQEDFPQFVKPEIQCLVPAAMLQVFLQNVNESILPSRYCGMWRYAAGLYVAHFSTLYLKTYSDGSVSAAQAATKGQQAGLVSEAAMGDTSIKYDNTAVMAAQAKWGSWNSTQYGQQLITMARMIGMGGMYIV